MTEAIHPIQLGVGGIEIPGKTSRLSAVQESGLNYLQGLGLDPYVVTTRHGGPGGQLIRFRLSEAFAHDWTPQCDTTQLAHKLGLDTLGKPDDLDREILLSMLLGPVAFAYPNVDELESAVRVRRNIVLNARKTALAFDTEEAERPTEYWQYAEATGFTLLPGKPLIAALEAATQPDRSGKLYSFSCYRATEYVILLGLAQELARSNPKLLGQLQRQWETRAIMSGQFHDVFLKEYGSMNEPLPLRYYVPGDRLWFRNPDEASSNAEGYEGSWVMYLGGGLFTNFWKRDEPFTLTTKCVELYHWRHATYMGKNGKLQVDDNIVDDRVRQSLADPQQVSRILEQMLRLREPGGVYVNGGCIDTTREHVRWVRPGTSEIFLPDGGAA
ncbi:hypothetical protein [Eoetvoesiella caeni]|uniref:Uncharacterized protein n=1 Tax=Eoetvoesiella caeni TaxID=645616 RepID=A0A366HGL5_9BURK|nr:hypothetical protein [Eoetvoesiella caeni]MCI2807888.1 hypothetical protein [Eoetvoesiella caeni]NYT54110.1 hypothetical protein [Eoetvoesiella caeni]RBP41805.1 hypothetical protein DFR37_102184 [Eoetvoesiella caeni]